MALIEYRIIVDDNGNATVIQDVQEIGPNDQIRVVCDHLSAAIKFDGPSPFASVPTGNVLRVDGQVGSSPAPRTVTKPNTDPDIPNLFSPEFQEFRRAFHFQCGSVDAGGNFT